MVYDLIYVFKETPLLQCRPCVIKAESSTLEGRWLRTSWEQGIQRWPDGEMFRHGTDKTEIDS